MKSNPKQIMSLKVDQGMFNAEVYNVKVNFFIIVFFFNHPQYQSQMSLNGINSCLCPNLI